jgi:hypothetical protein
MAIDHPTRLFSLGSIDYSKGTRPGLRPCTYNFKFSIGYDLTLCEFMLRAIVFYRKKIVVVSVPDGQLSTSAII